MDNLTDEDIKNDSQQVIKGSIEEEAVCNIVLFCSLCRFRKETRRRTYGRETS